MSYVLAVTLPDFFQTLQKHGVHQLSRRGGVSEGADGGLEHHGCVCGLQEVHQ